MVKITPAAFLLMEASLSCIARVSPARLSEAEFFVRRRLDDAVAR
jgi:hypothetical protein